MDLSNADEVTIKAEPESNTEDKGKIPYMEINIDLLDVKKECLEHQITGKHNMLTWLNRNLKEFIRGLQIA